eukprot:6111431-Prymnesium_polylepis.1
MESGSWSGLQFLTMPGACDAMRTTIRHADMASSSHTLSAPRLAARPGRAAPAPPSSLTLA